MLNLALIVGSTRPGRFADTPAEWIREGARARKDFRLETLDLRDFRLPFFGMAEHGSEGEAAVREWRAAVGRFDGYIVTAAEYNHAPTAVLKNALDSASAEWNLKPVGFVGYGGVGAARAVEQLRMIAVELQMAPVKQAVHINMEPLLGVMQQGRKLDDYAYLVDSRSQLFDQMVQWAAALKPAREGFALAA